MRIIHHHPAAAFLGFVIIMTLGCDGSTGPTTGPTTGAIDVTISTAGASIDVDPDGYSVRVDGGAPRAVGVNAVVTIGELPPGNHLVQLEGVASNCSVSGSNPRSVTVIDGDKAASPVGVAFSVSCIGSGSIQVTTATTGDDLDPDGYSLDVLNEPSGFYRLVRAPPNGTTAISALTPGTYLLKLSEVTPNCSVAPSSQTVVVGREGAASVAFEVRCTPSPKLAFTYLSGLYVSQIYTVSVSGGISSPLTALPGSAFTPAWSPDGSRIAFATDDANLEIYQNLEIYVMNRDGSNPVRLTSAAGQDTQPAWSPDGARIAFASNRPGKNGIYLMNADGTNPVRLSSQSDNDSQPTWSPDGTRIGFSSNGEIRVMNADGSGQRSLTTGHSDQAPEWSPDGTRIAFSREASGGEAIFIMNADGSNVTRLTSDFESAKDATWSPDGSKIAFAGLLPDNDYWSPVPEVSIFVVGIDGTNYQSPTALRASSPAWSRR